MCGGAAMLGCVLQVWLRIVAQESETIESDFDVDGIS